MSVSLCTQCGTLSQPSLQYINEFESSSLLHNLRTSNFPATDQEASHIQHSILPNIETDISSISAKIRSLQDVIISLQQELEALTTVRNTYQGLISPCRAVPRELWEQIFSYVHESDQINNKELTVSDPTRSIWVLAQVCQTWRSIAVSLRPCWRKLRLAFPKDKSEGKVRALKMALQRSGQHPLDIILTSDYPMDSSRTNPFFHHQMLAMVHAESHRWRDACLYEYRMDSDILFAPLRGGLPMLESLNLHLTGGYPIVDPAGKPSVFGDCPRLTKVVLTGTRLLELPWTQITELRLEDIRQEWDHEACMQFVSLVGRCPNLVLFQARDFEVEEYPLPSSTICPSIRVLNTAIGYVMDSLTLPHLQEVSLASDVNHPHEHAFLPFYRLLQRSQCASNITSLRIRDISLYNGDAGIHDLYAILSATTHLEVLSIEVSVKCLDEKVADLQAMDQITKVIDALSVDSQDIVTFLPRLSSFDVDLKHHMHYQFAYCESPGRLVAMLKARWEGDDARGLAKLKRFHFSLRASWIYVGWRLCGNPDEIGTKRALFSEDEGRVMRGLAMDGMDVAIRIHSVTATTTVKSKVAQQLPGEPSEEEAEYRKLFVSPATY